MAVVDKTQVFIESFRTHMANNTFIKGSLGNYQGKDPSLKNIYLQPVIVKNEPYIGVTFRHRTNDIIKNYSPEAILDLLNEWLPNQFHVANLFSTETDYQWETLKNKKVVLRQQQVERTSQKVSHDRQKQRRIEAAHAPYLHDLGISNREGMVLKEGQDKFKQINHYIELLSPLLKELPQTPTLRIADMGSGKGYLTFALYDHLHHHLQRNIEVIGVEYRQDLVDKCNTIAQKHNYSGLQFVASGIAEYPAQDLDVLIALHACDTATDDAIYRGIQAGAQLIVTAPCCHKEIRRAIEKQPLPTSLSSMLRYGIFRERQAEMLTDSLRALVLEYCGYRVGIGEFISTAHTPKNMLITAQKIKQTPERQAEKRAQLLELMTFFGIQSQHLIAHYFDSDLIAQSLT